jgi:hypothetical protein
MRPAPADPGHDLVCRVSHAGPCRCHTRSRFIRATLRQEALAWQKPGDGLWSITRDEVLRARAVLARRLPVQPPRLDGLPLPQGRAADGQRRPLGGRVPPLTPHDLRPRCRDVHELAPEALGHGSGDQALPRAADLRPSRRYRHVTASGVHETSRWLAIGPPRRERPRGAHAWALRRPLPEGPSPLRAAQVVAPSGPLPQGAPGRQRQPPPSDCGLKGRAQRAPTPCPHHAYRPQKAVAAGTPRALGGSPPPVTTQCRGGCSTHG